MHYVSLAFLLFCAGDSFVLTMFIFSLILCFLLQFFNLGISKFLRSYGVLDIICSALFVSTWYEFLSFISTLHDRFDYVCFAFGFFYTILGKTSLVSDWPYFIMLELCQFASKIVFWSWTYYFFVHFHLMCLPISMFILWRCVGLCEPWCIDLINFW